MTPDPIRILNPDLTKRACCFYGDWFALDLLLEIGSDLPGERPSITKVCPACGATVTVDWVTETVTFEARKGAVEDVR